MWASDSCYPIRSVSGNQEGELIKFGTMVRMGVINWC